MTITAEQLVSREVHYCVSHLVSTLASGYGARHNSVDLEEAAEQAFELCSPIDDYENAAKAAGFGEGGYADGPNGESKHGWIDGNGDLHPDVETACFVNNIEPYEREIFEHWIVSDWLADKLAEKGEKVDKDFCGLTVWARTTTGQGIANDWVIEQIVADLNKGA